MPLRFFYSPPDFANKNMAIDEALYLSVIKDNNNPFIRFYSWSPPALSFGYNQKIEKLINPIVAYSNGYQIVRRPTGGRMVFHNDELTFSMGFSKTSIDLSSGSSFINIFKYLLTPLVEALQFLGLDANFSHSSTVTRDLPNTVFCYSAPAAHSIFLGNKKLIGAAAQFKNGCMSIHGSIPLSVSFPDKEIFITQTPDENKIQIASLSEKLDKDTLEALPKTIAKFYEKKFNLLLTEGVYSPQELLNIGEFSSKKYTNLNWKNNNATQSDSHV